jgi:hypothetical protein
MKTTSSLTLRMMLTAVTTLSLQACLVSEDKGTVEVGTPPGTEADFTVSPPPTGQDTAGGNSGTGPVLTDPDSPSNDDEGTTTNEPEFSFSINNGAPYVLIDSVQLQFSTIFSSFNRIKVSNNDNCTGGSFEPYVPTMTATNFTRNSRVSYSVIYRDVDGIQTNCFTASIIHDNKGPDILFSKYPLQSIEQGQTGEIQFSVKDVSPIVEVKCKLNSIERACLAGENLVSLTQMPEGSYTFTVDAKDIHGFTSTKSIQWEVVSRARFLSQTVEIKEDKKVDILIVVDNSGSMSFEQNNMASRVRNMLAILRGFDYRIAVTTTDPNTTRKSGGRTFYGDGDLIPIHGQNGALWVDSNLDEQIAQNALGLTLQRPEVGSGSEQGIKATYRFIERATTPGNPLSTFFREGANFSTLVISDEDESANTEKNDPEKLLALISSKFNQQKAYSFHSIITKPGDTACFNGEGATYGHRYKKISDLTGGVIGSVCESDYAAQVQGISTSIRDLIKQFTLTCSPLPEFPITIKKNGVTYSGNYTIEGVNLKFTEALPAGQYKIDYACLK